MAFTLATAAINNIFGFVTFPPNLCPSAHRTFVFVVFAFIFVFVAPFITAVVCCPLAYIVVITIAVYICMQRVYTRLSSRRIYAVCITEDPLKFVDLCGRRRSIMRSNTDVLAAKIR